MKNQNYFKPQRTEGVQPLSAIDSKNNKKFSQSDWAHDAEDWLTRQEGWEDSKPSSQQAIGAHILRVEKLTRQSTEGLSESEKEKVEARNSRNKERLKKAVIDRIMAGSEESLESDPTALRTLYGHDLPDDKLIEKYLNNQREKLGAWVDYLDGETDAKLYPTWFKIYVMDGIENMGRYNAEKGVYEKRSNGTVAEYPDLNPAALAKTFDVVNDFYVKNNKPKEEKERELFNSGSFNRIYSKIKSETTFSVEVPGWFDDIKGSWKEYNPGMTKELTAASQGTPWCIQGSNMADRYLGYEGGKFYLFHLEDSKTGVLSDTAAASIRMAQGKVAEISGVRGGESQSIDISLLPSMIEKLEQLPGNEDFSDRLSRSLELIKNFPENARREGLRNTLNEIRRNVYKKVNFDEGDVVANNLKDLKKDFTLDEILANVRVKTLDPYIKAGFDKFEIFEKADRIDSGDIDTFIQAGIPPEKVFEKIGRVNSEDFNTFVQAGVPPEEVFEKVNYVYSDSFNTFIQAGFTSEEVFEKIGWVNSEDFNTFVQAGVPPEEVFEKVGEVYSSDIDTFIQAGIPPEKVFERVRNLNHYQKIGYKVLGIYGKLNRFLRKTSENFSRSGE